MNKVLQSGEAAVALIPDGAFILMGGFGLCGIPENLIRALRARWTKRRRTRRDRSESRRDGHLCAPYRLGRRAREANREEDNPMMESRNRVVMRVARDLKAGSEKAGAL